MQNSFSPPEVPAGREAVFAYETPRSYENGTFASFLCRCQVYYPCSSRSRASKRAMRFSVDGWVLNKFIKLPLIPEKGLMIHM